MGISRVGKLRSVGRPRPNNSKTIKIFRPKDNGWYGDNWEELSHFIKKRDNYTCLAHTVGLPMCGKHMPPPYSAGLHAHHIVPLPRGSNLPDNLVTLCIPCHEKVHGRSLRRTKKDTRS